ncbi:MAG: D-alanine--D-alanine ligase family protein [Microthrixaceae bacterium]
MQLPPRVRLVVIFGGRSAEHDISCVSASHVLRAVDPRRYEVVPVAIGRDGSWQIASAAAELVSTCRHDELPDALSTDGTPTSAFEVLGATSTSLPSGDTEAVPTVVLPILHGPNGEDGTIQGLLETAGIPYVGAGVLGSAVAMDKAMAKTVLDAEGIPQPAWRRLDRTDHLADPGLPERLLEELGDTVFVKPANMGSSIGVSKANGPAELHDAIELALRYDDVIVVEEAVEARELECAVLGNTEPKASTVGEIVPGADFYDYEDKYADGVARTEIPAQLDPPVMEAARALALRTYRALRAEGMARVDMFLVGDSLLVNEINTLPGFTPISMYPMLWEASGIGYSELIDELVALAIDRHERRSRLSTQRLGS